MPSSMQDTISALLNEHGFSRHGFARLEKPLSIDLYRDWLTQGMAGEMEYLKRHYPLKEDPQTHFAQAKSAIVVAVTYVPHPHPPKSPALTSSRIALYARGEDYHFWFKRRLEEVITALKQHFPEAAFTAFTDSGPVLERDLAYRAGLGWIGKNTCLLDRHQGSLCFLGEIYTSLEFTAASLPVHDHCGTCTRCLDACPTQALKAPRTLDARRCISYLTIEAKAPPPEELRPAIGDWLFGCDICQTVCPWNLKVHGKESFQETPSREGLINELKWLLQSSNKGLEREFHGTALMRTGAIGLKRNALIVAANQSLKELYDDMTPYTDHPRLGEVARWAQQQLTTQNNTASAQPASNKNPAALDGSVDDES